MPIHRAVQRADAIVVDLEDSLAYPKKESGRALLRDVVRVFRPLTSCIWVRVNSEPEELASDLDAIQGLPIDAISPTKVESPDAFAMITARFPSTYIVPTIETPRGILRAESILAHPSVRATIFGAEDFAAELGVEPSPEALLYAAQHFLCSAAAYQLPALGVVGNFRRFDKEGLSQFRALCEFSRDLGFSGTFAVSSAQIRLIKEAFSPTPDLLAKAEELVRLERDNSVYSYHNEMVGPPVIKRMRRILERNERAKIDRNKDSD